MTRYILHGWIPTRERTPSSIRLFSEAFPEPKISTKILLILFAQIPEHRTSDYFERSLRAHIPDMRAEIEIASTYSLTFLRQYLRAQVIWITGGDYRLLQSELPLVFSLLARLPFRKTIVGGSAGAHILASYGYSLDYRSIMPGLGILPIKTICHAEQVWAWVAGEVAWYHPELLTVALRSEQIQIYP